jgi:two-component system response regulator DctR
MLHIIDDEEVIRDSLLWLARSRGIAATAYDSGKTFLASLDNLLRLGPQGQCVLLDVRMPDISGIALFDLLPRADRRNCSR